MSAWSEVIKYLNEEKEILRKVFYGNNFKVLSSTMDEYLWLLCKCGYLEFTYIQAKTNHRLLRGMYSEYVTLKIEIPENLTFSEAVKIKKQPWLAWFKYYDKKNKL